MKTNMETKVPQEKVNWDILQDVVDRSNGLIEKMLRADNLMLTPGSIGNNGEVQAVWTVNAERELTHNEYKIYKAFITDLLVWTGKRHYTQQIKSYKTDNEKFAASMLLNRMGYKGAKYQQARLLLKRHLKGDSGGGRRSGEKG